MTDIDVKKLVDYVDRMPGFSPAVLKIISLSNDMRSTPNDLVNAVSMDAVLTAKILRLVNSAYFGPGKNIASLNRAVIMLGFNTIKNIALSVSVASAINIRSDFEWFSNDEYWEHCLGCALASRMIAKAVGVGPLETEEYFVAGLLHDIGKAVFIQRFRGDCKEIYNPDFKPETPRYNLELERFGLSHATLGGMIAQRWKFPDSLSSAIESHHTPLEGPEEHRKRALVVHVANLVSHHLKIGIQTSLNLDIIDDEVWTALNLDQDKVLSQVSGLEEAVENAKAFLQKVD